MKKLFFLLFISFTLFGFIFADGIINLSPGWNVLSTPKLLSGISFSNSGNGVFFYALSGYSWASIVPNIQNIKPLEGFVVNNATTGDVTMTLNYRSNISPMETLFQKTLNLGWNLLGITTITDPFTHLGTDAIMSVDFTNNNSSNLINGVNNSFTINNSSTISSPQLGEAYGIFVTSYGKIYGGSQNSDFYDLSVSLENSTGGNIPYGISSLPVATYLLQAGDGDVTIESVTINQGGESDDQTLYGVALFINGTRVSKVSNIMPNIDNTLSLYRNKVISAGDSVRLTVKVFVPSTGIIVGDNFNLTLNGIESTAGDVRYSGNLTSDTYTILNNINANVTIISGLTGNVDLGDTGTKLFDFNLKNNESHDVKLFSITLKVSDSDFINYYNNFTLNIGSDEVSIGVINDKYITFILDSDYLIEGDKNITLTVNADIIGGIGQNPIQFSIEKSMDVEAVGTGNMPVYIDVSDSYVLASLKVNANVVLGKIDPDYAYIMKNTTGLFLGALTIKGDTGTDFTFQDLELVFTGTGNISDVLKNIKVKIGSISASFRTLESSSNETIWSASDLGKSIGSGLTIYVYADTENIDMIGRNLQMRVGNSKIEIASNDEPVTNITPSTLVFPIMRGVANSISINYESQVTNNKNAKSILAGTDAVVAEYSVYTNYEAVNVGEMKVKFSSNLENSVTDVELRYNGEMVASNPTWSSTGFATFTDVDFDIATSEKPLTVKLVTTTINEDGGVAIDEATVNGIYLYDLQGATSADTVTAVNNVSSSSEFDIVPVTIFTSVVDSDTLRLFVNRGNNTSGTLAAKATLRELDFVVQGNNGLTAVIVNDFNGTELGSEVFTGGFNGDVYMELNNEVILSSDNNDLEVLVTKTDHDSTFTLKIAGVRYTTNVDGDTTRYSDRATTVKTIVKE